MIAWTGLAPWECEFPFSGTQTPNTKAGGRAAADRTNRERRPPPAVKRRSSENRKRKNPGEIPIPNTKAGGRAAAGRTNRGGRATGPSPKTGNCVFCRHIDSSRRQLLCVGRLPEAGIYVSNNSQFKVALKRFTATLSSKCVKHTESSRFLLNCVELPIETQTLIHVTFRHDVPTTPSESRSQI